MTLSFAPPTPAFTGGPSRASRRRLVAVPARGPVRRGALRSGGHHGEEDVARQGQVDKIPVGTSTSARVPSGSTRAASGEVARGGKGSGKTTRSQRTNKVYKTYLTGRPTVDDVERASRGDRTKAMGVVEREAPYRLNRADREAWERAKRRGGHGHGDGTGGGGFLEIQTKQTNALAPHRHPLVNTHRLYCDAKTAPFVLVEQDRDAGRDEIVVDLSTLRVERDGAIRARLLELADEIDAEAPSAAFPASSPRETSARTSASLRRADAIRPRPPVGHRARRERRRRARRARRIPAGRLGRGSFFLAAPDRGRDRRRHRGGRGGRRGRSRAERRRGRPTRTTR